MFEKIGQFFVMLYNDFFYLILIVVLALAVAVVLLILRHIRNSEEEKLQQQEDFKQQSIESLTSEEIDNISNNSADPEEVKQYLETEIDQAKKTKKKKTETESSKKKPTLGIKKPRSKNQPSVDETAVTAEAPTQNNEDSTVKKQYTGKWKIVEDEEGFYAILTASNGGALLKTEKYKSISNVRNGIETVKKNIEMGNFAISVDKDGRYRYKLFNSSNRLICVSDTYSSKAKCERGIESVKRFSQTAMVIIEDK
ncbi:MAG: DUF1508 domain-containing protein [Clostridiales bacterium]|nr:DUF1508 domain-containing protein [Clostridiales bacterium]